MKCGLFLLAPGSSQSEDKSALSLISNGKNLMWNLKNYIKRLPMHFANNKIKFSKMKQWRILFWKASSGWKVTARPYSHLYILYFTYDFVFCRTVSISKMGNFLYMRGTVKYICTLQTNNKFRYLCTNRRIKKKKKKELTEKRNRIAKKEFTFKLWFWEII